jgi:hypothetical protein
VVQDDCIGCSAYRSKGLIVSCIIALNFANTPVEATIIALEYLKTGSKRSRVEVNTVEPLSSRLH